MCVSLCVFLLGDLETSPLKIPYNALGFLFAEGLLARSSSWDERSDEFPLESPAGSTSQLRGDLFSFKTECIWSIIF